MTLDASTCFDTPAPMNAQEQGLVIVLAVPGTVHAAHLKPQAFLTSLVKQLPFPAKPRLL